MEILKKSLGVWVFEEIESSGIDEAGWGMINKQRARGTLEESLLVLILGS